MTTRQIWNVVNYLRSIGPGHRDPPHENCRRRRPAGLGPGTAARRAGWTVDARSGRPPAELASDLADADALLVRSATKVTPACSPPRRACASSRAPAPASTTSTSPPPAPAASSSSTRRAPTASASPSTRCALMLALARVGAGRRSGDEGRQVGEEAVPRHRAARQDARHRRPRTHRPGGGAARPRVRHARRRARSVHLARDRRTASASSCCRSTRCARRPTT